MISCYTAASAVPLVTHWSGEWGHPDSQTAGFLAATCDGDHRPLSSLPLTLGSPTPLTPRAQAHPPHWDMHCRRLQGREAEHQILQGRVDTIVLAENFDSHLGAKPSRCTNNFTARGNLCFRGARNLDQYCSEWVHPYRIGAGPDPRPAPHIIPTIPIRHWALARL